MTYLMLALALTGPAPAPSFVAPDGARVQLELATTDQQKSTGLMGRTHLAVGSGMLFVFRQDGILPFWMKDTLIPLDLIWLDRDGVVVELRADLQPCRVDPCPRFEPKALARAALLVNAGFTSAHGVKPGTSLRFEGVPGFGAPAAQP
jgi:uncharacterized membrane protein (UPF0127 family)